MSGTPLRVMIVEDHEPVRRGMTSLLQAAGGIAVCAEARTVAEAGRMAEASDPDVAVVDLRLSDGSGVQACREIRARCPGVQIVLLTATRDEDALLAAVVAGASGYLLKELRSSIVEGVRAAAEPQRQLDRPIVDSVLRALRDLLSEDEQRVLALLAEGKTDAEIAEHLGVDQATVQRLVDALFAKIGIARSTPSGPSRLRRR